MSKFLLFPIGILITALIILLGMIGVVIRLLCHPFAEVRAIRLYFLVSNQLRLAGLVFGIKTEITGVASSIMFYERSKAGNRFVYMFAQDGECLIINKTTWDSALGEDSLKLVQFERGLLQQLESRFRTRGTVIPEGETYFQRVK